MTELSSNSGLIVIFSSFLIEPILQLILGLPYYAQNSTKYSRN